MVLPESIRNGFISSNQTRQSAMSFGIALVTKLLRTPHLSGAQLEKSSHE